MQQEQQGQRLQPAGKSAEDYLLRREDQTLKAFESHSTTAGNTLLAAYLLWLLPNKELAEGSLRLFNDKESLRLLLVCAVYAHFTFNVHVIGSLAKRIYYHASKISANPNAKTFRPDSTRLLQPGPLGLLQWAAVRMALWIALRQSGPVTFITGFVLGILVLILVVALLLAPLVSIVVGYWPHPYWMTWVVLLGVIFVPLHQCTRLFFRYSRPYVYAIRGQAGKLLAPAFSWFSDLFDRSSGWDDGDNEP